jgi:hypothetical protein
MRVFLNVGPAAGWPRTGQAGGEIALDVGLVHRHDAGQVACLLARLDLEAVPKAGLLAQQLAPAGDLDPLGDPAVRLVLGHDSSVHR